MRAQEVGLGYCGREDLADIFGRGRIVPDLKAKFKKVILAMTGITSIHGDCVIQLQ